MPRQATDQLYIELEYFTPEEYYVYTAEADIGSGGDRPAKTLTTFSVTTTTAQAKFGSSSMLVSDRVLIPGDSQFQSGDFTVEMWIYRSNFNTTGTLWDGREGGLGYYLRILSGGLILQEDHAGGSRFLILVGSPAGLINGQWNHIAIVRSSGSGYKMFVNGSLQGSNATSDYTDYSNQVSAVGAFYNGLTPFDGYIDEVRFSNTARYTTGFTPSSTAFTNDSDTSALIHFDGDFSDDIGQRPGLPAAFTLQATITGTINLAAALTATATATAQADTVILADSSLAAEAALTATTITILQAQAAMTTALALSASASTVKYADAALSTASTVVVDGQVTRTILSDFAVGFTQTAAFDRTRNVRIGYIGDRIAKTISTYGNVEISTAQSKFGSGSALITDTGDYFTVPGDSSLYNGDFTVEMWLYASNLTSIPNGNIWDNRTSSTSGMYLYVSYGSIGLGEGINIKGLTSAGFNNSQWNHIALVRNSTTAKVFVNGVQKISATVTTTNYSNRTSYIGSTYTGSTPMRSYFDEVRLSSSVRYTTGFTPSTAAFTSDVDVRALLHLDTDFSDDIGYAPGLEAVASMVANTTVQGNLRSDLTATATATASVGKIIQLENVNTGTRIFGANKYSTLTTTWADPGIPLDPGFVISIWYLRDDQATASGVIVSSGATNTEDQIRYNNDDLEVSLYFSGARYTWSWPSALPADYLWHHCLIQISHRYVTGTKNYQVLRAWVDGQDQGSVTEEVESNLLQYWGTSATGNSFKTSGAVAQLWIGEGGTLYPGDADRVTAPTVSNYFPYQDLGDGTRDGTLPTPLVYSPLTEPWNNQSFIAVAPETAYTDDQRPAETPLTAPVFALRAQITAQPETVLVVNSLMQVQATITASLNYSVFNSSTMQSTSLQVIDAERLFGDISPTISAETLLSATATKVVTAEALLATVSALTAEPSTTIETPIDLSAQMAVNIQGARLRLIEATITAEQELTIDYLKVVQAEITIDSAITAQITVEEITGAVSADLVASAQLSFDFLIIAAVRSSQQAQTQLEITATKIHPGQSLISAEMQQTTAALRIRGYQATFEAFNTQITLAKIIHIISELTYRVEQETRQWLVNQELRRADIDQETRVKAVLPEQRTLILEQEQRLREYQGG